MLVNTPNDLLARMQGQGDPDAIRAIANAALAECAPDKRNSLLVAGTGASPFFVPTPAPGTAGINGVQLLYMIAQARTAAAALQASRVLVAAPMKSGSTFVTRAISQGLGLPRRSLSLVTTGPYDFVFYEAGMQAFRIDELALLVAGLAGNYVAHHHLVCSPMMAGQLKIYGIRPVLIRRNIFDCLLSLEEFYRKDGGPTTNRNWLYFNNGMPFNWPDLDFEGRMNAILDRYLQFYVDYYVSWSECERRGLVEPLWISYENDILGDKTVLAARIAGYLGVSGREVAGLTEGLMSDKKMEMVHFNKGIAGRGAAIQGENRERVLKAFHGFDGHADWSEILG